MCTQAATHQVSSTGVPRLMHNVCSDLVFSPTREIALLLYTGGYRPGLVANLLSKLPAPLASALSVEDVELKIEETEPRVEASLKVQAVGNEQMIRSKGNLVAESDVRMRETFMKLEAFGQTIELPGPFKYSRNLLVTYLVSLLHCLRFFPLLTDIVTG